MIFSWEYVCTIKIQWNKDVGIMVINLKIYSNKLVFSCKGVNPEKK